MKNKQLLSRYGLKWNPFNQDLPIEGIVAGKDIENFCWRIENLVMDGGFAMITGPVGIGKSVALRWLSHRLEQLRDVRIMEMTRPKSGITDFYRELGDGFGVDLRISNKWGGYQALRDKWIDHISSTLFRPVLIIDEAQEMPTAVLSELRLMTSNKFDSQSILTVIFGGDDRFPDRFRTPDHAPLASRIKTRLVLGLRSKAQLSETLEDLIKLAGNPTLMTKELIAILAEKSMGNHRSLVQMAEHLLFEGLHREQAQLDESLFFEIFDFRPTKKKASSGRQGGHQGQE